MVKLLNIVEKHLPEGTELRRLPGGPQLVDSGDMESSKRLVRGICPQWCDSVCEHCEGEDDLCEACVGTGLCEHQLDAQLTEEEYTQRLAEIQDEPVMHWCDVCGAEHGLIRPSEADQERIDTPDGRQLICTQCREDDRQAMWVARCAK